MSDRFNTPQIKDANLSLEMKHKMNNDVKYYKDKLKEVKLKNLVKYGNNSSVSINVRHGCTTCFTLPIINNTENNITYTIKIDDALIDATTDDKNEF